MFQKRLKNFNLTAIAILTKHVYGLYMNQNNILNDLAMLYVSS